MSPLLDVTDPAIRQMVAANHVPQENYNGSFYLTSVTCVACNGRWPCPPITALRTWRAERRAALAQPTTTKKDG